MLSNRESEGKLHTNWLNMMYSRIKLSKNLLKNDGVFVISIDHYEVANLIKICDEIFGENNKLGIITVVHKPEGRNQSRHFGPSNEFALFYAKSKSDFDFTNNIIDEDLKKEFTESDRKGRYKKKNFIRLSDGKYSLRENKPDFYYPIYISKNLNEISTNFFPGSLEVYPITTSGIERTWKTTKNTCQDRIDEENIIAEYVDGNLIVFEKLRESQVLKTHWIDKKYHAYHYGTKLLDNMLGVKTFDFPKSVFLVKDILNICLRPEDTVLDFFSGSATTAHSTLQLNAEDGGNRKFIMVQLPEQLESGSEAYRAGYRTICDIGQERIRLSGELIKKEIEEKNNEVGMLEENPLVLTTIDVGYKVLKLDKSNIREWNADFENLEQELDFFEEVFVDGRSELDIVYEIMIKNGLELTYPVDQIEVNNKNIYDVASGNLFICLDDDIDIEIAKAIIEKKNEYGIETSSVVFKDSGFNGNDSEKLNVIELLKDAGYPEENLLTI